MSSTARGLEPGVGDIPPGSADASWTERFEFISKIVGAFLALTYVSGYLVATTFLSRFGLSADVSDLLRAKYLYIGFLFWTFVAVVGVIGRALALLLSAITGTEHFSEEEKEAAKEVLKKNRRVPSSRSQGWRPLRRWTVLSLVLVPFALQIVFLDPNAARAYVPLQSILLLTIVLYQSIFYREFSKEGYAWGSLYGQWYVDCIRTSCIAGPGVVTAVLMIGRAIGPWMTSEHTSRLVNLGLPLVRFVYLVVAEILASWVFWIFGSALILFLCFVALFVTLGAENLKWLDENGTAQRFQGAKIRRIGLFVRDCMFMIGHAVHVFTMKRNSEMRPPLKQQLGTALYCFVVPFFTGVYAYWSLAVLQDEKSEFNARALSLGTLILALVVISNVILILARRRELSSALNLDAQRSSNDDGLLGRSDVWLVRILMISILYLVSVLGFAFRIYPFIPVQKAGGDYSTADAVTVHLMSTSACSPSNLNEEIQPSTLYIVLSEDANWIYLAPRDSGGGPSCWKWGPFCSSLLRKKVTGTTADPYRPTVYTVNRRCVADMVSSAN